MPFVQEKQADLGQLIGGSFAALALIKKEIAIYLLAFTLAAFIADTSQAAGGLIGIVATLGYFGGQYYLYRRLLSKSGLLHDDGKRVLGFFAMAIVLGIPIYLGFAVFIIPGIILAAKWIMAPTFIVASDRNVFEAIGDSWRASSSNTLALSLAFTIIGVIWLIIFSVIGGLGQWLIPAIPGSISAPAWLALHVLPLLLMGLSFSAYRQLSEDSDRLAEVFA